MRAGISTDKRYADVRTGLRTQPREPAARYSMNRLPCFFAFAYLVADEAPCGGAANGRQSVAARDGVGRPSPGTRRFQIFRTTISET